MVTPHSTKLPVTRVSPDASQPGEDAITLEEPLEIRLQYWQEDQPQQCSVAITMRTPGDDIALAVGFLSGEGIIKGHDAIASADHCGPKTGDLNLHNVVKICLKPKVKAHLDSLDRNSYTTSSCGICGKSSLEAVRAQMPEQPVTSSLAISRNNLSHLPDKLIQAQTVFSETGGLHAAGLFDCEGKLLDVTEDIGRHNAVDKLVGRQLLKGNFPLSDYGVLVSGRASFELAQKTIMAGCGMLAAVSAPSSLAVALAKEFDIGLVGFLRDHRFNVYTGQERVL